ncbi:uncharacterized protein LOC124467334 isoform X3 [Hypomesus transpacificus]|uniref:uncharacterized protein LOC124467334 isoform X3 n=1 Tax=Hypomesus transpacificus TaxID=137520 RepID=UPI001F07697D|nr:uncharacterized protein LOC124467334 isoform X3 [Hypomesus transpacificus]
MEDEVKCQVCGLKFTSLCQFQKHVRAAAHQQRVAEIFQKDVHKGPVYFPTILVPCKLSKCLSKCPLIGLNVMTLCISSGSKDLFYLCHVCEEKCSYGNLVEHLASPFHYSNYYSYTEPDQLSFAWLSDTTMQSHLLPLALKEVESKGSGQICIFDMPGEVLDSCKGRAYSKVMQCLTQTELLAERITAGRPKQISLQEYMNDPNRKNPLLGLQHIVEYICKVPYRKSAYLCTLCARSLPANKIISHILGFDHIYWYLKEWHPSTLLMKDCYKIYSSRFSSMMLNVASQAETIRGTANADIKQVELEPALFTSVGFSCYKRAFERLESIRNHRKESSLKTIPKPGDKLTLKTLEGVATQAEVVSAVNVLSTPNGKAKGNANATGNANANATGNANANATANAETNGKATAIKACDVESPQTFTTELQITGTEPQVLDPAVETWKRNARLNCVNCKISFLSFKKYKLHLLSMVHVKVLKKMFGPENGCNTNVSLPHLNMYECLKNCKHIPSIGIDSMVVCVTTEEPRSPLILCNVCWEIVPESVIYTHLVCQKHLLQTLKLQCPDRLPFGWDETMPVSSLKPLAYMEEQARAQKPMMIKILDLPARLFSIRQSRSVSYVKDILNRFAKYLQGDPLFQGHNLWESKYPLLGQQFLVQYNLIGTGMAPSVPGYLCLLCEKKCVVDVCSHVFSYNHVTAFLECAHPGTLKDMVSGTKKRHDVLLDLAKQAQKIHPTGGVQNLMKYTVHNSAEYKKALEILNRLAYGKKLKPVLKEGRKLVPSDLVLRDSPEKDKMTGAIHKTIKETDTTTQGAVQTSRKDPDSETSDQNGMDCRETGTGTASETLKDTGKESDSETVAEPKKGTRNDKDRESREREPKEDTVETTEKSSRTTKKNTTRKETERQPENKNVANIAKKRPLVECVRILNDDEEETGKLCESEAKSKTGGGSVKKRKMMAPSETTGKACGVVGADPPSVTPPSVSPTYQLWNYLKTPQREPVIGLSQVIECHAEGQDPFYVCEACQQTVSLPQIITHLTSAYHQQAYMQSQNRYVVDDENVVQRLRLAAQQLESEIGSGVAQVVELEDFSDDHTQMDYNHVLEIVQESLALYSRSKDEEEDPAQRSVGLWSYLNNSDRRQPVIGLKTVTETQSPDQPSQNHFCCDSCSKKFPTESYIPHLISAHHRYNYIKREHPQLIHDWPENVEPTSRIRSLCQLATELEHKEGWGRLQVKTQPAVQSSTITTSNEDTTRISDALWKFTQRPDREPVIGLSMLTEFRLANTTRPYFLCSCCSTRMLISACTDHIVSPHHRYNYLKQMHPDLTLDWPKDQVLTKSLHGDLRKTAAELERREGCGTVKVMERRAAVCGPLESQPCCSIAESSHIADTSTTDSPDTAANPDPVVAANPDTVVAANPDPVVAANPDPVVAANPDPVVAANPDPVVAANPDTVVAANPDTVVAANPDPVVAANPDPVVAANPDTVVAANPDTVVADNPDPAATMATSDHPAADPPDNLMPETQPVFSDAVAVSKSARLKTRGKHSRRRKAPENRTPRRSSHVVGIDFVVAVSYRKKTCFFCQLCSIRMNDSTGHMTNFRHQYNYLRWRYPGWTAHPTKLEKKLIKMASYLAKADRDAGLVMQKVRVNGDEFKRLVSAPELEALRTLKAITRSREQPGKTPDLRRTLSTNPDRAHGDQGPIPAVSSPSGVCDSEREDENRRLLVQIPVCLSFSKILVTDQEPLPCPPLTSPLPVFPTARVVAPAPSSSVSLSTSDTLPSVLPLASALLPSCITPPQSTLQPCPDSVAAGLGHGDSSAASQTPGQPLETPLSPEWWERSDEWVLPECASSECTELPRPVGQGHDRPRTLTSYYAHLQNSTAHLRRVPSVHLLPNTAIGKIVVGPSNLSKYLVVKALHDKEPIIGLDSVMECRGISQDTFFMCVSCAVTLPSRHICEHIVTVGHQYCYIRMQHPAFLAWVEKACQLPLLPDIIRLIAWELTPLEASLALDAQVIRLDNVWYERVKSAPFHQALDMLQIIHEEPSHGSLHLPPEIRRQQSWEAYVLGAAHLGDQTPSQSESEHSFQTAEREHSFQTAEREHSFQTAEREHSFQTAEREHSFQTAEREHSFQTAEREPLEPPHDPTRSAQKLEREDPAQDPPRSSQKLEREEAVLQPATTQNPQKAQRAPTPPHSPVSIKQELNGACGGVPAQPGETPLPEYQDCLYADQVQFSPDVQELTSTDTGVCEVELEETFSGSNLDGKRPSRATENPQRAAKHIRDYVQSRRTEAVVGLCAVIECLSEGQEPFYLCVSCKSRLNRDLIINHVLKYRHRQMYLTLRYPWHFKGLLAGRGPAEQSMLLMQVAKEVEEENHDEPGTLQKVHLDPADFKEIRLMLFEKAVTRLQEICRQKNQTQLLTRVIEKPEPVLVKQEVMEGPVISHHEVRQKGKRCSEDSRVTALERKRLKVSDTESAVKGNVPDTVPCRDALAFPQPIQGKSTCRSSHTPLNSSHKPTKTDTQIKSHTTVSIRESESNIVPFTDHPNPRDITTVLSMDKSSHEPMEKGSTAPATTGLSSNDPCIDSDTSHKACYKLPLKWLRKQSHTDAIKGKHSQIPNAQGQHHSHSDMAIGSQKNAHKHSPSSPKRLQHEQAIERLLTSSELPSDSTSKTFGHPFGHSSNPTTSVTINASQTTHLQDLPLGKSNQATLNLARSASCPDSTTVPTSPDSLIKQYSKEDCQKFVDLVLSLRKNGIIPQATTSASPNNYVEVGSRESKTKNMQLEPQPRGTLGAEIIDRETMGQRVYTMPDHPMLAENMSDHVDLWNYEDRVFPPNPPNLSNSKPCYDQPLISYADASYRGIASVVPLIADHNPPTHPELMETQPMEGHLVSPYPGLLSPMSVFHGGHYSGVVSPRGGYREQGSFETGGGSTLSYGGSFYPPLSAPVARELRDVTTNRTGSESDTDAYRTSAVTSGMSSEVVCSSKRH